MALLIRRSALVICILAVAGQASAEVVLLSQCRAVFGEVGSYEIGIVDTDSLSAPDFGLFQEEISVEWLDPFCGGAWGSSTQDSEIQAGHFSIHGNASADAMWNCDYPDAWYRYCAVRSDFEVHFEVLTATSFSLNGSLATGSYGGFASLQLDRNGEPYLSFYADGNDEIAVGEDGVLAPGTYALTVKAMANADDNNTVYGSFDFDFFLETTVASQEKSWGQVKAMFR